MDKRPIRTPKFWTRFLKWFCDDSYFEELQGDLEESYRKNLEDKGIDKAKALYRKEVLKMIRGSIIKPKKLIPKPLSTSLFRFHVILSIRSIRRNTVFSLLNVVGFGAAISVCLFLVNIIYSAQQIDKNFSDRETKYRINTLINSSKGSRYTAHSPLYLYPRLKSSLPEAERIATLKSPYLNVAIRGTEINLVYFEVSPDFLNILDYKVISGSITTALNDPNTVIISEDLQAKYFNAQDVIGLTLGGKKTIAAVIESPRSTSHLNFEALSFNRTLDEVRAEYKKDTYLYDYSSANYIQLYPQSNIEAVQEKLDVIANELNETLPIEKYSFSLENLSELSRSEAQLNGLQHLIGSEDITVLLSFLFIMVLIASINYTNLTSAKALHRIKEIGIRRVVGSKRLSLLSQFLIETCFLGILGLMLGLIIYKWFANDFSYLLSLPFNKEINLDTLMVFFLMTITVSIFAGLVPGWFLSRISPLSLFKKKDASKSFSFQNLRKVLLVIQLTISGFVFIFGCLYWQQYQSYIKADTGLNLSSLFYLNFDSGDQKKIALFKEELNKVPEISATNLSTKLLPINDISEIRNFYTEDRTDSVFSSVSSTDTTFFQTYLPNLLYFDQQLMRDNELSVIVNRSFLKELNIPLANSIGTIVTYMDKRMPIVGVTEHELSSTIYPIATGPQQNSTNFSEALILNPNLNAKHVVVRIPGNTDQVFKKIESAFALHFPDQSLTFYELNSLMNNRFEDLKAGLKVFGFTFLCIILITLMGQIGMAIFQAETKTKEIGIRKVLGASVTSINLNLIKNVSLQLLISLFISVPIAFLAFESVVGSMKDSLKISPFNLLSISLIFALIILSAVISQTLPKAKASPVDNLRHE